MNSSLYKFGVSAIVFIVFAIELSGQPLTIKGQISDGQVPIRYADIALFSVNETGYQQHTLSDSVGYYQFKIRKSGAYFLRVSYMGFGDFASDTIEVNNKHNVQIVNIILEASSKKLDEVVITSKKAKIEIDRGKIVYNLQNSALSGGLTAYDLLKRLPGVSIGQDDNLQFRGSAGVNVLLNGKMTYLSGAQLINFLNGLNAEDVQKLEIIASPGAEFDAAGNAGMINIVTKKPDKKGYAVSFKSGVSKGKYWMTNQSISASLRTKQIDIYGALDYNTPHRSRSSTSGNTLAEGGRQLTLERRNEVPFKINFYTWKAGIDWQLLPKHTMGVFYHGYFDDFRGQKNSGILQYNPDNSLQSTVRSTYDLQEPYYYHAVNLNHQYAIDSLGKKLVTTAHYIAYRNYSDALMTSRHFDMLENPVATHVLSAHQPVFITIRSVQTDADLPFKKFGVKGGLKYAEVSTDNNAQFDSLKTGVYVPVPGLSNHFRHNEQIIAGYASAVYQWSQININTGLRLEHTIATSRLLQTEWKKEQNYTRLFPNLSIDRRFGNDHRISISASRRINRPAYAELNPVRWYNDEYFYYSGNPGLVPEMSWLYSTTYMFKGKYLLSASYSRRNDFISEKQMLDDNGVTIKSQSANFGRMNRVDLGITIPVDLFKCWNTQIATGVNYTDYPISVTRGDKLLSRWAGSVSVQQHLDLPYGIKADISTVYTSRELWGSYLKEGIFYTDIGIRKSFFKNRWEALFTFSDLFNGFRISATSLSDFTDYHFSDKPDSRRIGFIVKYHFGGDVINNSRKKTEEQERL
jgi:hypothetical protein